MFKSIMPNQACSSRMTLEKRNKFVPAKIAFCESVPSRFIIKMINRPIYVKLEKVEENCQTTVDQNGIYKTTNVCKNGQKTFVSTCYFQPKEVPVSYSETVIINVGSPKKEYFETVYYETKLEPFRWTETVETVMPFRSVPIENPQRAHKEFHVEKPLCQYISLDGHQENENYREIEVI